MANSNLFNENEKGLEQYLKSLSTEELKQLYKHYSKISLYLSKLNKEMMFDFNMCQVDKIIIKDMLKTYKRLTNSLEKVMRYED